MSRFQREIFAAMSSLASLDDCHAHALFSFPREFIGFQGHFAGRAVLPGICKLRAAQVVLESVTRRTFRIVEITNAKYFAPVTHDEEITVDCQWQSGSHGLWELRASIKRKETRVALLHLVLDDAE